MGIGLVLESDLYMDLLELYKKADIECNYRPEKYLNFISVKGGINAAKELIKEENEIFDIRILKEKDRLDLTVEALITKSKYKKIFTREEIDICKKRLEKFK